MKLSQLCTLTAYETGESIVMVDSYCQRAKELGYDFVAVCDSTLRSYPSFSDAANKYGLKPVFGYKTLLKSSKFVPYKIYLYIKNEDGYLNLCKILSLKKKVLTLDDLKEYSSGLKLVIQADNEGYYQQGFLSDISPDVLTVSKIFQSHFAFGITLENSFDIKDSNVLYDYVLINGYKVIPFPVVRYLYKKDEEMLEILKAGLDKKTLDVCHEEGPNFLLSLNALKTIYREEDYQTLDDFLSDIDFEFFKKRGELIKFEDDDSILKENAIAGLKKRLSVDVIPDNYQKRIDYELSVIKDMNFSSYFLLVSDYVRYAKEQDIKVGPGRGSASGALVSYAISITDVDPIKYDLSFERFLNPKRKTMPDIDIDFDGTRRDEIAKYLEQKYGFAHVSTIRTYTTLKAKSALALVGTALAVPEGRIKKMTSCIRNQSNNFDDALDDSYQGRKLKSILSDEYYLNIWNKAKRLYGLIVGTSVHAPGLIISKSKISSSCPREDGNLGTVEYEYAYMERLGFLKVDILSLPTLSYIREIEERIIKSGKQLPSLEDNLDDKDTFDTLNSLALQNIFQLEKSPGMSDAINVIKPKCFKDLAAILALYRPGPMGYIKTYADRKNGREKVVYADNRLEPILKDTYGIMVYQEQVMQAVMTLASFSAGDADLFRRAISKKDIKKMNAYKDEFIKGCLANSINEDKALKIYADIEKFANYGFNKSHAYSYAMLTYRLLYYKTHYPLEFYTVSFKENSFASETSLSLIRELNKKKIRIHLPNINSSDSDEIVIDGTILYPPLSVINGLDHTLKDNIVKEREKGPFLSFYDFCLRLYKFIGERDKRSMVSLIEAGAFDSLCKNRIQMETMLDKYLGFASLSFSVEKIPPITGEDNDYGRKLAQEKAKIGLILSKKLSSISYREYYKTLVVTDTSRYEFDHILIADDEAKSYQLQVEKKEDIKKYDIILVDANFRREGRIYPNDIIIAKKEK